MIMFCDLEANGLLEEADKIHVISVKELGADSCYSMTGTQQEIKDKWLEVLEIKDLTVVFHNGLGYDLPLLEKLFGIPFSVEPDAINGNKVQIIDTLVWSRNWYPDLDGHGLEDWAKRVGTYKPEVQDWENLPLEVYVDRCENDVLTTEKVFVTLAEKLGVEYE
jgi:DNA polymerase III alpha subunit (gram-positive type)